MSITSRFTIFFTIQILRGCITGMPRIELKLNEIPFERPFRLEHLGTPIVLIRDGKQRCGVSRSLSARSLATF